MFAVKTCEKSFQMNKIYMPAKLTLMLEISRKKKYTDGLKIFRSQELLPVSLETQYGGG